MKNDKIGNKKKLLEIVIDFENDFVLVNNKITKLKGSTKLLIPPIVIKASFVTLE